MHYDQHSPFKFQVEVPDVPHSTLVKISMFGALNCALAPLCVKAERWVVDGINDITNIDHKQQQLKL